MKIVLEPSDEASQEINRLLEITTMNSKNEIFRHALSLLRIYIKALQDGKELIVTDPDSSLGRHKSNQLVINLPFKLK